MQLPKSASNLTFSYSDVVPIKHYHYLKEYDFQKNLPSLNPLYSKQFFLHKLYRKYLVEKQNIRKKVRMQVNLLCDG